MGKEHINQTKLQHPEKKDFVFHTIKLQKLLSRFRSHNMQNPDGALVTCYFYLILFKVNRCIDVFSYMLMCTPLIIFSISTTATSSWTTAPCSSTPTSGPWRSSSRGSATTPTRSATMETARVAQGPLPFVCNLCSRERLVHSGYLFF